MPNNNNNQTSGMLTEGVEYPWSNTAFVQQELLRQEEEFAHPIDGSTSALDTHQKHLISPDMPGSEINQADVIYNTYLNSDRPQITQLESKLAEVNQKLLVISTRFTNLNSFKKQLSDLKSNN